MEILVAFLVFSLLVIVHEYGHYIVAVKNGIAVEEFAVGMGPLVWSRSKGETLFTLRLLPLGGYCKMKGMEPPEQLKGLQNEEIVSDDEDSFQSKTVWQRISVIFAGSFFNFLLLAVIMLLLVSVNGAPSLTVGSVSEGFPAAEAGLIPGDTIISVDSRTMHIFQNLQVALSNSNGREVELVIERGGELINKYVTPTLSGNNYVIGILTTNRAGLFSSDDNSINFFGVIHTSFWQSIHFAGLIISSLINLITGGFSLDGLAGPVGLITGIGQVYEAAIYYGAWQAATSILTLAALLSVNLAIFNLLPVPPLDGGLLVFLFIEAVRGKPISPEKEGFVKMVGVALLILLIIAVSFNDIMRLFN